MADAGLWALAVSAALAGGAALALRDPRIRAFAMVFGLVLAVALVALENWDDARFRDLRGSTALLAAVVVAGAALVGSLAVLLRRRPELLGPLAVAALPFRIPIEAGGDSANLLLPLYVVIAGAVLAVLASPTPDPPPTGPRGNLALRSLPWALAALVVLYAAQSLYSDDFSQAAENVGFFLVPFSVLAALLLRAEWKPRTLAIVLAIVVAEALLFAFVAFAEYATRELLWNPGLMEANEIHSYFRVNSLFWDPNIFGRYLAVTIVAVTAVMIWLRSPGRAAAAGGIALVLVAALATTLSQSSLVAVLAGLAVLAALRWSARWTAVALGAGAAAGVVAIALGGGIDFDLPTRKSLAVQTSGRSELIRGGLELAADHPVQGLGSGSFEEEFEERFRAGQEAAGTVSHTEPVTVAVEQGAVGFALYVGVVALAFVALLSGIRRIAPGLAGGGRGLAGPDGGSIGVARLALVAALAAMFVHSLSYAAFFTDPITWVLLTLGLALARGSGGPAG